jgi:hypothetical protein
MKTIKKCFFWPVSVLIIVLAGAALASAQSQIVLAGWSPGVTLDTTTPTSAQVSFGTCNGSTCSISGTGAVVNSTGSAVSSGSWNLAVNGGPMTVSNTGAFERSPVGTFTFKGETGMTGTLTGTFTLAMADRGSQPQFSITTTKVTGTGSLATMFPQGSSSTDLNYRLSQLLCSSSGIDGCKFQNRFNNGRTSPWPARSRMTPAPEPTAAFLLGSGLLGLSVLLRRRHKLTHSRSLKSGLVAPLSLRPL